MLLTKTINAWDVIRIHYDNIGCENSIDDENGTFNESLYNFLCDNYDQEHLRNSFDFLVCNEFPNGCDEDELIEFFNTETKLIKKEM